MWEFFVLKPQIFWRQKVPLPQRFLLFFYIDLVDVTLEYENFYYCCWTTKHQCHRKDNAIKVYIQLVLLFKEANCIARFQSNMTGLTTCCFEDNIKVLWQLLQCKINSLFENHKVEVFLFISFKYDYMKNSDNKSSRKMKFDLLLKWLDCNFIHFFRMPNQGAKNWHSKKQNFTVPAPIHTTPKWFCKYRLSWIRNFEFIPHFCD